MRLIAVEDPREPDVHALLEQHLRFAKEVTPPEDVHALDLEGLLDPTVTLFSLREDGKLLGIGALKQLDQDHVELKSMHTVKAARGRGVGRALLEHLVHAARSRGAGRVSLETGTMEAFAAARSLYATFGFTVCAPFGEYTEKPNSVCMTLAIADH